MGLLIPVPTPFHGAGEGGQLFDLVREHAAAHSVLEMEDRGPSLQDTQFIGMTSLKRWIIIERLSPDDDTKLSQDSRSKGLSRCLGGPRGVRIRESSN